MVCIFFPVFLDWAVTCEFSDNSVRRTARAHRDGVAAATRADEKRRRYPASGGELVPFVVESGGRPCDSVVSFIRSYGHGLNPTERADTLASVWRRLSRVLQTGNADTILSAIG